MPRSSPLLLALLAAALAPGCTPSCEAVCRKLVACETADNLNRLECEEACEREANLYEVEDDDAMQAAFADHRRCLGAASCDEIAAGECYDEDLFRF